MWKATFPTVNVLIDVLMAPEISWISGATQKGIHKNNVVEGSISGRRMLVKFLRESHRELGKEFLSLGTCRYNGNFNNNTVGAPQ